MHKHTELRGKSSEIIYLNFCFPSCLSLSLPLSFFFLLLCKTMSKLFIYLYLFAVQTCCCFMHIMYLHSIFDHFLYAPQSSQLDICVYSIVQYIWMDFG